MKDGIIELSPPLLKLIREMKEVLEHNSDKSWPLDEIIGVALIEMDYELSKGNDGCDKTRDQYFLERILPLFTDRNPEPSKEVIEKWDAMDFNKMYH